MMMITKNSIFTGDDGRLEEVHGSLEAHFLQRGGVGLNADTIECFVRALVCHVGGDE